LPRRTVHVEHRELGAKVVEHAGEDAPALRPDELDAFGVAQGIHSFGLLEASSSEDHDLCDVKREAQGSAACTQGIHVHSVRGKEPVQADGCHRCARTPGIA
jgi:hypothetical protein